MIGKKLLLACCIAVACIPPAFAHSFDNVKQIFEHKIPNLPGKSMIAVEVDYKPGGSSPAHRHPNSSFIMAYVLSGAIRSQVEGEAARVYRAGETWYEAPGAHHLKSENVSKSRPAKLLAVFVVDSNDKPLVTADPE